MVRQEKFETASTVTSIIPASTVNSDHNSTIIVTQNNQPAPFSFELVNLERSNTLEKAKDLANRASYNPSSSSHTGNRRDYGRGQSGTEGKGSVDDFQTAKMGHSEADNNILPSKQAHTATTSLSGHIQSQPQCIQQCTSVQEVPDPCRPVEELHEFLPDCEKIPGPSQYLHFAQWMAAIYGGEKHDAFDTRMEEKQPSTTQTSAKNSSSG
ncbi:hypothetical protein O181_058914 [Austropuccinia psidii MF-1]|uniref:Uncharacterized protein n=1 Tax=Austropuccinia psidii MF-1 TaxID=1389203 RepID=A0A9Q3EDE8_9BASI|nr:hypothetical protein [Austropuccinia psidii MF-1]